MANLFRIILVERRIPGRFYKFVFDGLDRIGMHIATIRNMRNLRVTGYTNSFWMYFEIWSKRVYDIDELQLGPGMKVVDIGANQGFYSLYVASLGADVWAIEPSSTNYRVLRKNVEQNKLTGRIQTINAAVSSASGTTTLFEGVTTAGQPVTSSPSIRNPKERGGDKVKETVVNMISINDYFKSASFESCDLLKLDCEGSEYDIIPAMDLVTLRRIRYIVMEFHGGCEDLKRRLEDGGFEILSFDPGPSGILKARNKLQFMKANCQGENNQQIQT